MQGTRNESIPPNPKTRLPHDVNPHTRKACNVGFRVTEGKRQTFNPRTPGKVRLVEVQAPMAMCYFNPRTPGGVRLYFLHHSSASHGFQSTHPGRGATVNSGYCLRDGRFQSTHPRRGATEGGKGPSGSSPISIHAPRAGCDYTNSDQALQQLDFNPRTPGGMRQESV